MAKDPEQLAHLEWLGYVQPSGLVVSIPALLAAQAQVNRNIIVDHQRFLACLPRDKKDEIIPEIRDFPAFTQTVFGWEADDLLPVPQGPSLPEEFTSLEVVLSSYNETLRPRYVVRECEPEDKQKPWLMLIQVLTTGVSLDEPAAAEGTHWQASPQAKFERLLRETETPIGLLVNGTHLRLIYAPRGENSGFLTFSVAEMAQVTGRPIFAGLHMLLSAERLFSLPQKQRLPAILAESRKYQNLVSTKLAGQVLAALYELLRGFQAADDQRHGELLRDVLADDPNHVYAGLLAVLMRLVFILYAEDKELLPRDAVYTNHYSILGLFERLRADAGRYPDTMDLRYGAWAQLLTLFRILYVGGQHGGMRIPARKGHLFDPDCYPFLEGRAQGSRFMDNGRCDIPRVSDGVIYHVLNNLLILDGERLSYRTLDVEQIGSVYETIMGFNLEVARGMSIAIKPAKKHGAPATINLKELLAVTPANRAKWFKERTGQSSDSLKSAATIEDLLAALDHKIDKNVTPNVVPAGSMVFQPSDERRRSGSHYTPRSLTEPIVRTTLRPILERLGDRPTPEQILELKVCDPAMGSGAFLVEACRQLAEELVQAWHAHNRLPVIPPDEDELKHAQRVIAQRCLYGVDKNPMAVDLAKLSLWLATLAKDHAFTFLDHNLRCGDSLVGLTRRQIASFHWNPSRRKSEMFALIGDPIAEKITQASGYRQRILESREDRTYLEMKGNLDRADDVLKIVRLTGDLVIAAFFSADKEKKRIEKLDELGQLLVKYLGPQCRIEERPFLEHAVHELRSGERPVSPFHWEIEFPEVFSRENGGFDAIVGNPPFAGKNTLINGHREGYLDWLLSIHEESHGNADLVAHFYRRAFNLVRKDGCFGLIATNTIGQGDTRSTGLRWICTNGGTIYAARRRYKWPGMAAVVISIVQVAKGRLSPPYDLDGRSVPAITAYLFHAGWHDEPEKLEINKRKTYIGSYVLGMGFTFDDTDTKGIASPLSMMEELIQRDPRNAERIFPYIGGEEVNNSPTHAYHRYVINFEDWPLKRADLGKSWFKATEDEQKEWLRNGIVPEDYPDPVAMDFPELVQILLKKVKPERAHLTSNAIGRKRAKFWWQYGSQSKELYDAIRGMDRVLVLSRIGQQFGYAFLPTNIVFAETIVVFVFDTYSAFSILQSRVHEIWARFFASSLEDRLRYTPSDCFETFPFPLHYETDEKLEAAGKAYYEFRAQLMVQNNEGLTKTYNRFHDPNERSLDIRKLRELHAAMDRAVLEAYGWDDLNPPCEFLLDYEEEEDEEETASRRKKPWRYRWPDEFRDEILARLLELNQQRAELERQAGLTGRNAPSRRRATRQRTTEGGQINLLDVL